MNLIVFILNLPWTLVGFIAMLLSGPKRLHLVGDRWALVVTVRSFWWYRWLPGKGGVRAMAHGHIVQLGPLAEPNDLPHELIHVDQYRRKPLVHPILYALESWRHGYRHNKYEVEAYTKSDSRYAE